ncbi:MAG TPA: transketolase [bacterium]|nr:transketolase [bacterium]HOL48045.1 transketolase [bacterium]HPQ19763.1 transketolase [bacterium]
MDLIQLAKEVRKDILRSTTLAGSGHPGGSLSIVEVLLVLYFKIMNIVPDDPQKNDRDRFVLCKGHSSPALYSVLAHRGFFDRKKLDRLRQPGSFLQGHPDRRTTPGVDMSTGSLGQGLSIVCGMALAARLDKLNLRVYALLGDGELQEGQCWEAFMAIGHFKLDNVCAVIDYNKLQIDGRVNDLMRVEPLKDKLIAFNWNVLEIDGHNFDEIEKAFNTAKSYKEKPTVIISHTIKGKGISFMENNLHFHGNAPTKEEYERAIKELE